MKFADGDPALIPRQAYPRGGPILNSYIEGVCVLWLVFEMNLLLIMNYAAKLVKLKLINYNKYQ